MIIESIRSAAPRQCLALVPLLVAAAIGALPCPDAQAASGKLKVFILAGQSNMEGHAKIETFDYIGDDPKTAPLLKKMRGEDGKPIVRDDVWISYFTGNRNGNGEGFGPLTAGYGSRPNPQESGGKIGPEFTFGIAMGDAFKEPVLIIKTAWGGKSLFYNFRPPSSGVYQRSEQDIERKRNAPEGSGHYYRLMIEHVRKTLSDIKRIVPSYDASTGYEIAGFVWFQGWNDMVNRGVYPENKDDKSKNRYANYSKWMADFIRDVRKDLEAPKVPFVIGVMGVGGKDNPKQNDFRKAMAAPANLPEFKGNVAAVQTSRFWSDELGAIAEKKGKVKQMGYFLRKQHKNHANADGKMTKEQQREHLREYEAKIIVKEEARTWERGASNAAYHYLGCANTFATMGVGFADALLEMRD